MLDRYMTTAKYAYAYVMASVSGASRGCGGSWWTPEGMSSMGKCGGGRISAWIVSRI